MMDDWMKWGGAFALLERGKKVARRGWDDAYLFLAKGAPLSGSVPDDGPRVMLLGAPEDLPVEPTIYMRTPRGTICPWFATNADLLANDWIEVE